MTLYKYLSLAFSQLLVLSAIYGQSTQDKALKISNIKNVYQRINSYNHYRVVTLDDDEAILGHASDNGASLTGYFKSDSLEKITEWIGLSTEVIQNEYYFDKSLLVFVYSTKSSYRYDDSSGSFDYSKLDNIFKGRYYYDNGKLIEAIVSDKEPNATKEKDAVDFLNSSNRYARILKAKK
jgi:hypothetical protein